MGRFSHQCVSEVDCRHNMAWNFTTAPRQRYRGGGCSHARGVLVQTGECGGNSWGLHNLH
uniref:ADAM_CR_2 domain-containing protein n=1 Tax=Mesocestoides corti TaxID=53468 RepID=A0A5K3FYZ7_MESCO